MDARKERIEGIFGAAIELKSPEQREVYLATVCRDDRQLRAEVDELIQAYDKAGGFLTFHADRQEAGSSAALDGGTVLLPVTEKAGDRIGRYKLLQQIGEGGCGVVYMAEQEEPVRRRVALKVIKLGMDTKSVIARFEAERQALALMDHPNIAKVLDAGATETGRPYFVMELVRGIKITEYCDQHNLSTRERLALFLQVCHAIQHAHQKGIIHRDIKPSNILVSQHDGVPVPVVIDFGIAKATAQQRLTDKTLFTAFEQFIGTPAYMSPEQAEMSRLDIDTRSDIYALGVLLYELLTGQTPFDAKTLLAAGLDEMRRIIREQEPVRPSTRLTQELRARQPDRHGKSEIRDEKSEIDGDLDWIVMKCLEKDRTRRYETANGLAQDIERHLKQEPVAARPPSAAYRVQKFVRRNRVMVMAGGAVAAALVLGIVVSTWQAMRVSRLWAKAEANERKAVAAQAGEAAQREFAEAKAEESRKRLVQLNVANGLRLMNAGELLAALPWLVEALRLEEGRHGEEDLQRMRVGAVLDQCPTLVHVWFHRAPVGCAAFSPDGRHIATGTGSNKATPGQVQIWEVGTGAPVGQPMEHGGSVHQLCFSPDGNRIATASTDGTARIWDSKSGEPVTRPLSHTSAVLAVVFSHDGTRLATASGDHTARVWNAENGSPATESLRHLHMVTALAFSPDGARLVTVSADGFLRLWHTRDGMCLLERKEHSGGITRVHWSPDGSQWVTASIDRTAKLWDAHRGLVRATLPHETTVSHVAFSPDGSHVATASEDGKARVWDARTGALRLPPVRHDGEICQAQFSPDGLSVLTASRDQTARVWDALSGRALTPPLHHGGEVLQAVFSPDGRRLVTTGTDGTARLWELATIGPSTECSHRLPVNSVMLSADQRRLLTASADGTAQLWDLGNGEQIGPPIRHRRGVSRAVLSPDGQRILTASYDRTARVWEANTGKPVTPPLEHQEGVVHAAFSPDGRHVATASLDRTAAVWDAATGQPATPRLAHDREVQWVAFSPDGRRLVTACRDRLARVWDATSGLELLRLAGHNHWVLNAAFSPDGQQVLTASADGTARLWDAQSGEPGPVFAHGDIVISVAFNADGNRVLTSSYDQTARVWDAQSGHPITPPLRHENIVRHVTFSQDGRLVVTASTDQTVRLWHAVTGDPITPALRLHEDVRAACLSADGQRLITAAGAAVQVRQVPSERRSVTNLVLLTHLLTGQATDSQGRSVPLGSEAIQQAWQTAKTSPADPQPRLSRALYAWHRRGLTEALKQHERFGVQWHLDRLLRLAPDDESLQQLRDNLESGKAILTSSGGTASDPFAETRSQIPPQPPGAPADLIDLSDYYNRPLSEALPTDGPAEEHNLSSLTRGIQILAGMPFDLRGLVRVQGVFAQAHGYDAPEQVTGIKVGRTCRRLHFLHGTGWVETEGREIARFIMHFADGQRSERPIRYGNDARNFYWLAGSDSAEHPDAVRAWAGTNALTAETGVWYRLYKSVWDNPRPDVPVETVDLVSTMSASVPFLIAITAE